MEIDKYFHMYGTKDKILFEEVEKPEQPEKKTGRWMTRGKSLHYCSECGWALMDSEGGDQPYMGIGYNRSNEERWICCPGWNSWLMNFCPNCGADMRKSILEKLARIVSITKTFSVMQKAFLSKMTMMPAKDGKVRKTVILRKIKSYDKIKEDSDW